MFRFLSPALSLRCHSRSVARLLCCCCSVTLNSFLFPFLSFTLFASQSSVGSSVWKPPTAAHARILPFFLFFFSFPISSIFSFPFHFSNTAATTTNTKESDFSFDLSWSCFSFEFINVMELFCSFFLIFEKKDRCYQTAEDVVHTYTPLAWKYKWEYWEYLNNTMINSISCLVSFHLTEPARREMKSKIYWNQEICHTLDAREISRDPLDDRRSDKWCWMFRLSLKGKNRSRVHKFFVDSNVITHSVQLGPAAMLMDVWCMHVFQTLHESHVVISVQIVHQNFE